MVVAHAPHPRASFGSLLYASPVRAALTDSSELSTRTQTTSTVRPVLRRWERSHWADWLVPAAAASVWCLLLWSASDSGAATRRSMVFLGGPALLLSGLHARLTGYLHAPGRQVLLPLPLPPAEHFAAGRARHIRGLAVTGLLGTAALALSFLADGHVDALQGGLLGDWLTLFLAALGVEPAIAAGAAWLGRRFAPDSLPHRLQHTLGGGWTLPEAVAHLYLPALGIGAAVGLALPAQLAIDLAVDGHPVPTGLWVTALGCGVVAVAAFVSAPFIYARGLFEAVPFLAEATRTLAGPPVPDPAPRFVAILPPVLRLIVLQYWRLTPVPALRLLVLVAVAAWLLLASTPPDPPRIAVFVVATLLWVVPATTVTRLEPARARLLCPLPIPARQRRGSHPGAAALLWTPAVAGVAAVLVRWGVSS